MKSIYVLVVAAASSLGVRWWSGQQASPSSAVAIASVAPATSEGTALGEATVLTSHTYMLLAPTSSRLKRSYIELGHVAKKGAILLKFDNYNFLVAPTSGIVTQQLVTYGEYVPHLAPVVRFTELYPFRLRLPAGTAQVKPGALLQVVVSAPENGAQLLNLRLHTLSSDPIAEGEKVHVKLLAAKQ
jgi:hypothetical protein